MCVSLSHGVNDFVEVEEESDVSLSTPDEPKPISEGSNHSLQRQRDILTQQSYCLVGDTAIII